MIHNNIYVSLKLKIVTYYRNKKYLRISKIKHTYVSSKYIYVSPKYIYVSLNKKYLCIIKIIFLCITKIKYILYHQNKIYLCITKIFMNYENKKIFSCYVNIF